METNQYRHYFSLVHTPFAFTMFLRIMLRKSDFVNFLFKSLSKENKEWLANKLCDNDSQTSGKEEDSFSQKIKQSTLISCRQGISKSNQL
jgi:hypothetical protein